MISSIGLGTARVRRGDDLVQDAVCQAFASGINVVDYSSHYAGGWAATAVGHGLRAAIEAASVQRDEVVIVAKGGYIGGVPDGWGLEMAHLRSNYVDRGLFTWDDLVDGRYCMAPPFLEHAVNEACDLAGVEALDLFLIEGLDAHAERLGREAYDALLAAFSELEKLCGTGRLGGYGFVGDECLLAEGDSDTHIALESVVAGARRVAGEGHHLRVVSMPLNPADQRVITQRTQVVGRETVSPLEAARRLGVHVFTHRSIDRARSEYRMQRRHLDLLGPLTSDQQLALQFVRSVSGVTTAFAGMSRPVHVVHGAQVALYPVLSPDLVDQLTSATA
jgi:aryl-alcohol dehydrogenase-like predicted oxidoreductase